MNAKRGIYISRPVAAIPLAFCLLFSGCDGLFTVGVRRLHWNGLNVRQEGSRSHPERISSFSQLYYRPDEGTPAITIRMPDSKFIQSEYLNRDTLNTYIENGSAHEFQDGISVDYSRGRMTVYLDDSGQMKMMIIDVHAVYSHKNMSGKPPAIGVPAEKKVIEFPLREGELKEVFGEPTKDEAYLFNT